MKLLRVGQKGKEKPAALDKNGKIRDLSSNIKDLNDIDIVFCAAGMLSPQTVCEKNLTEVEQLMSSNYQKLLNRIGGSLLALLGFWLVLS